MNGINNYQSQQTSDSFTGRSLAWTIGPYQSLCAAIPLREPVVWKLERAPGLRDKNELWQSPDSHTLFRRVDALVGDNPSMIWSRFQEREIYSDDAKKANLKLVDDVLRASTIGPQAEKALLALRGAIERDYRPLSPTSQSSFFDPMLPVPDEKTSTVSYSSFYSSSSSGSRTSILPPIPRTRFLSPSMPPQTVNKSSPVSAPQTASSFSSSTTSSFPPPIPRTPFLSPSMPPPTVNKSGPVSAPQTASSFSSSTTSSFPPSMPSKAGKRLRPPQSTPTAALLFTPALPPPSNLAGSPTTKLNLDANGGLSSLEKKQLSDALAASASPSYSSSSSRGKGAGSSEEPRRSKRKKG